jgi:hypothetical protein
MKVLITETCLVNYKDDRGGVVELAPAFVDVAKETAAVLVGAGRALYTIKTDDPDKAGSNTASKEMLEAAKALIAAREKAEKAAAAEAKPEA